MAASSTSMTQRTQSASTLFKKRVPGQPIPQLTPAETSILNSSNGKMHRVNPEQRQDLTSLDAVQFYLVMHISVVCRLMLNAGPARRQRSITHLSRSTPDIASTLSSSCPSTSMFPAPLEAIKSTSHDAIASAFERLTQFQYFEKLVVADVELDKTSLEQLKLILPYINEILWAIKMILNSYENDGRKINLSSFTTWYEAYYLDIKKISPLMFSGMEDSRDHSECYEFFAGIKKIIITNIDKLIVAFEKNTSEETHTESKKLLQSINASIRGDTQTEEIETDYNKKYEPAPAIVRQPSLAAGASSPVRIPPMKHFGRQL